MELHNFNKTAIILPDKEVSYTDLFCSIDYFARHLPVEGQQSKVVIFAENSEGWIYAFWAVWAKHSIAVPVDASSTPADLAYILRDCTPQAIWVSGKCKSVAEQAIKMSSQDITLLVIEDYLPECHTTPFPITEGFCGKAKCRLWLGADSDISVIIYTSGTTGSPKGVILTFANLEAQLEGVAHQVPIYCEKRRVLILLPLHHVLPLFGSLVVPLVTGGGVALCPSLAAKDLMDTLCRGKVGIVIGVPRLWQTLYNGIKKQIDAHWITRALFNLCYKVQSPALSRLIFSSIQKKMGGHLDYCVSGGAALDKKIALGLKTLGLTVLEGYGMTETSPIISFTRPGDVIPGCTGLPLPNVEVKLTPEGELCAKGPNVMTGYYNRPEETAAVLDKDGFIHTGDLARFDEKGRVYITGRTKEIIVLSNGKNVQPYEIEFAIEHHTDMVKECAVTDQDDLLVAIIVPTEAFAEGKSDSELEDMLKRQCIEPYNLTVENYKKVMRVRVYHGDLPRTKLDKLQRFKLHELLENHSQTLENHSQNLGNHSQNLGNPSQNLGNPSQTQIILDYILSLKHINSLPHQGGMVGAKGINLETDLAMDSLDMVSLQEFLEQSFGVDIDVEHMTELGTVQALADEVAKAATHAEAVEIDWHKLLKEDHPDVLSSQLPTSSAFSLLSSAFTNFFSAYNSLTVKGTENIPEAGPFIVAPNHQSFVDGPLAISGIPDNLKCQCYFYATEEHVKPGIVRTFSLRYNIIIMERRNLKNSILKLSEILKQDKNIVIFPEGRRCDDGKVGSFKKMFAILSKELGVPVLPVRISGAYEALPRGTHWLKSTHIEVEYLKPIDPAQYESYDSLSDAVRESIINKQQ